MREGTVNGLCHYHGMLLCVVVGDSADSTMSSHFLGRKLLDIDSFAYTYLALGFVNRLSGTICLGQVAGSL